MERREKKERREEERRDKGMPEEGWERYAVVLEKRGMKRGERDREGDGIGWDSGV